MLTKQTIVIMGAGYTGRALAACLANGNFYVLLCDKDHSKAEAIAEDLKDTRQDCDVESMQCSFDGAWEADIIILSMDFEGQKEVAGMIKEVVTQKILVSTVHPDPKIISDHSSADCQLKVLQELLPNTKIVRILADLPASDLTNISKSITSVSIAGNDDEAVETVSGILRSVGVNTTRTEHLPDHVHENNPTL